MVDTSSAAALCYVRWGRGGGGGKRSSIPRDKWGPGLKIKFFWLLGAQFSLKQRGGGGGGGPPGAPPLLDPPLNRILGRCVAL